MVGWRPEGNGWKALTTMTQGVMVRSTVWRSFTTNLRHPSHTLYMSPTAPIGASSTLKSGLHADS